MFRKKIVFLTCIFIVLTSHTAFSQFGGFFNRPPTIDPVSDVGPLPENSPFQEILLKGISPGRNEDDQTVEITVSSDNNSLIRNLEIDYNEGDSEALLTFDIAPNSSGEGNITIRLDDEQRFNNVTRETFKVSVYALNNAPTFVLSSNEVEVDENSGNRRINRFAREIDDGDPEENQELTFLLDIENVQGNLQFRSGPTISTRNGRLEFEAEPNTSGRARIGVVLKDDGGNLNGGDDESEKKTFTINVKSLNRPPTINNISDVGPLLENAPPHTVQISGISAGNDPVDQPLQISATSSNTDLIRNLQVNYRDGNNSGSITFSIKPNASGQAEITVLLDDQQPSNNTTQKKFNVTVLPVNYAPIFELSRDEIRIDEDAGLTRVNQFARNIDDGDPEANQTLNFITQVRELQGSIAFRTAPVINVNNGSLQFEVRGGTFGRATIRTRLKDNGGTQNGGKDASEFVQFSIIVQNINDPPRFNPLPENLTYNEDAGLKEIEITGVSAGPNENQNLSFTVSADNQGLLKQSSVNYTQGQNVAKLLLQSNNNQFGTSKVTVRINDGGNINSTFQQVINLKVNPIADTPSVSSATTEPGEQTKEGLVIERNTVDGDEVAFFKITKITNGKLYLNNGTKEISNNQFITYAQGNAGLKFTPSLNATSNGSFDVQASLSKANAGIGGKKVTATISLNNDPPVIVSVPDSIVEIQKDYRYTIIATDPNEKDRLQFSVNMPKALERWLKLNNSNQDTAVLSGRPPANAVGIYPITVRVKDLFGATAIQQFNLQVRPKNKLPVISAFSIEIQEDDTIFFLGNRFKSNFKDQDKDSLLAIKISSLPQFGSLYANGIELSKDDIVTVDQLPFIYVPNEHYFGLDVFDWNASDGLAYAAVPQRVNIFIESVNDPPELVNLEEIPALYSFGEPWIYITDSAEVFEPDGDKLERATVEIGNFISTEDSLYSQYLGDLSYEWDNQMGILTISGLGSEEEYGEALLQLQYFNRNPLSPTLTSREILITLYDADTTSLPYLRAITFEDNFVELDIPSGFTPNDDGVNDSWNILNIENYESYDVSVYTRQGKRIFNTSGYYQEWDGRHQGDYVPAGVYYYLITLPKFEKVYTGSLTVLR